MASQRGDSGNASNRVAPEKPVSAVKEEEDFDSLVSRMGDPWKRAIAKGYQLTGGSAADFKAALINDSAQYGLVAALLLTITMQLVLTKSGDYSEGKQGTWQARVYLSGALASTGLFLLVISSSVSNILFLNQIPVAWIYAYVATPLPLSKVGLSPLMYFWMGVAALIPTLSAGIYVMDGSPAMAWSALSVLTFALVLSAWRVNSQATLNLKFMNERASRHCVE